MCAQNSGNQNLVSTTAQVGTLSHDVTIEGSPYLNEVYKMGKISIREKSHTFSLMRYDAFLDRFELIDENNKVSGLLKNTTIEVLLEGKSFEYITFMESGKEKSGYANPIYKGAISLYFKPRKVTGRVIAPEHGYEQFKNPKYEDEGFYLLKKNNRAGEKVQFSKREIIFTVNDKLPELKSFIKERKLKLNNEADVVSLLEYYNTLE